MTPEHRFPRGGPRPRPWRFPWIPAALCLLAWSCQLAKSEKTVNSFSFNRIADTLAAFDDVVIVLKRLDGTPLDTLYRGKVDEAEDVRKLRAPHWDGSSVLVAITGTKGGKVVYRIESRFDPATGERDGIQVFVTPDISLSSQVRNLTLLVGDSMSLPAIDIHPADLLDKNLEWEADPDSLVELGAGFFKAARAGNGELSVRLKTNPDTRHSIPFTIAASGAVPESLFLEPESLEVAANGPAMALTARIHPVGASPEVHWKSADTNVARVDSSGRVRGIRKGETAILAASAVRPLVQAFARVRVTGEKAVEQVVFATDSIEIQVGAAPESLMVSVLPLGANPEIVFSLSDTSLASILNGRISGKAAGTATVTAASAVSTGIRDFLIVKISEPAPGDTEPPLAPKVRVTPAGPTRVLRPTWSWSGGGGGSGSFQVSLDKEKFDSSAVSLRDTAFRPASDLGMGVHILHVRERDAAGNWSQPGWAAVEVDTAGPAAPIVYGTSPTSDLPRWGWASGGGGGAGVFRYHLGEPAFAAGDTGTADTAFTLTGASSGATYTLYVQERDAAGNWSPSGNRAIKYDQTKPSVSILAPRSSGTFITAAETVTVSGGIRGPYAIAKAEYTVDGGAAAAIAVAADGGWSIPSLRVANAKTTVLKIAVTDNLGNTGQAELSILRDSDPPSPPASLSSPASPTNAGSVSWTWKPGTDGVSGSGLSGKYRWKTNAGAWNEVLTPSAAVVALSEGANAFSVQEEDLAGNWSASASGTVVLDTKPPDAVSFTGIDSSVAGTLKPTWAWTPSASNGGTGVFILKLDGGQEFEWTARSFAPDTPLANYAVHTLTVKEKDQVAGVTGAAKSFRYRVQVGLDPSRPWGGLKNPPVKTAGCGKSPTVFSGKYTLMSGGQERTYLIDIPADYDKDKPYRLIYCSHWIGIPVDTVANRGFFGLKPLALAANEPAIFLAPQAPLPPGTWNTSSNIDNALFDDLLAYAGANLCIDSTRVFAAGFSFGGMMTYSLTTNHQNRIRAGVGIAPANYNIWLPNPIPTEPIAWMQTTGMADGTTPWVNNEAGKRGAKFIALHRGQDNGCAVPAEIPTWSSGAHLCYDFAGCREEFPVKACTFNGGHIDTNTDPGGSENWIPEAAWKFITQF